MFVCLFVCFCLFLFVFVFCLFWNVQPISGIFTMILGYFSVMFLILFFFCMCVSSHRNTLPTSHRNMLIIFYSALFSEIDLVLSFHILALPDYLASKHCDFKDDAIKKMTLNLVVPSHGAALKANRVLFTMAHESKKLLQITLPEEAPKKVSLRR